VSFWRTYHEFTKHTVEKIRNSSHSLDWVNMPDPFRHYEGVPVLDLPSSAPAPKANALDILRGRLGHCNTTDGSGLLSQLLFYSAAISATKVVPATGYRYSLRVNPSSGNLHPTEFHFATLGLHHWPDGLYHYRPSSHMTEQRATGDYTMGRGNLVFYLTTIAWREAWKYRDRAYRYCCHDIGHAAESLMLAGRACGYHSTPVYDFDDNQVARVLGVEDEWPMMIVRIEGVPGWNRSAGSRHFMGGQPNRLSEEEVPYPMIMRMHEATKIRTDIGEPTLTSVVIERSIMTDASFATVVRRRRSALDFRGGIESISLAQLQTLLACAVRNRDFITLYLYVHRVNDLQAGLYRVHDDHLELLRPGDHRVAAAGLSLSQELAGNSCVTFSMAADLERATSVHGDRGYRYSFFEAGAIGQSLYLAAEAMGFQSTGIGAFYDDAVHHYLGLDPKDAQVIYHFACGYAVKDNRITEGEHP